MLLVYTALIIPFRVAFVDGSSDVWFILEILVDVLFGLDIIVTFNTSYQDDDNLHITDRTMIAKRYLKGWFLIDLGTTIPFQTISKFVDSLQNIDNTKIIRLARLPRISKILKVVHLLKIFRLLKT